MIDGFEYAYVLSRGCWAAILWTEMENFVPQRHDCHGHNQVGRWRFSESVPLRQTHSIIVIIIIILLSHNPSCRISHLQK